MDQHNSFLMNYGIYIFFGFVAPVAYLIIAAIYIKLEEIVQKRLGPTRFIRRVFFRRNKTTDTNRMKNCIENAVAVLLAVLLVVITIRYS